MHLVSKIAESREQAEDMKMKLEHSDTGIFIRC